AGRRRRGVRYGAAPQRAAGPAPVVRLHRGDGGRGGGHAVAGLGVWRGAGPRFLTRVARKGRHPKDGGEGEIPEPSLGFVPSTTSGPPPPCAALLGRRYWADKGDTGRFPRYSLPPQFQRSVKSWRTSRWS